ncbi:nitroreductase family protein [Terribacillus saccharophilus]|uniref:Nitroreductase n=2 Tax=Terribacillus saccharophilus TaxID=361277 RepID=A0A268A886_9BACI|nr:nitroreductase family protein [Terribacillus saccharophilus]PAD20334.1 nitroreductase [Terribacillus saccharophilus]PAF18452.1 nitroreductase [Terribacillus saccharophilus]PAF20725.1 nitroreductase [Terribacillus saccharophilus]PAF35882.1 nitroreductase [Terribacillus saccharophilus]
MTQDFFKALENRRSIYALAKESPISDERIQEIVEFAVKYTPSAFNSQSTRVIVLLGDKHDRFWDITEDQLRAVVPADNFAPTEEKIASFRNGYGTVLFFEDETVVKGLQEQFALYADNFPIWSEQTSGMHQLVVWTALEMEGLGASLQHYNPLVDEAIQKEWDIPSNWKLRGQMPFGKPAMPAGDKEFQPLEERVKIIK